MKRLLLAALVVCGVCALIASGGWLNGAVSALYGWALMGYLLWRALPAVLDDVRRLASLRRPSAMPHRMRGMHL